MNKYGSRKFIIALLALAAATYLRIEDMLESAEWVKVTCAVLLLYGAANVGAAAVANKAAAAAKAE